MPSQEEIALYERLLSRYLRFYDALRKRERRPKSAAQRQFQDVAWGKETPVTDHEKAYVYHLIRAGILRTPKPPVAPDQDPIEAYPTGMKPVPNEIGRNGTNAGSIRPAGDAQTPDGSQIASPDRRWQIMSSWSSDANFSVSAPLPPPA